MYTSFIQCFILHKGNLTLEKVVEPVMSDFPTDEDVTSKTDGEVRNYSIYQQCFQLKFEQTFKKE